jgi:pyridoxine 5-phosphate synthase
LQNNGIPVSLFIDPEPEQIKLAHQAGANMIEIHTGVFCEANGNAKSRQAFAKIVDAAKLAKKLKLGVNAGHGLCYKTIKAFKGLSEIDEYSIGHSIVSRAVLVGLDRAVREMRDLIKSL